MGLLSLFKRSNDAAAAASAAAAPDAVAAARTRARQRLIGAAVLLGIGVIGFPLLFETQPRPIPVDIPIEIPRKDGAPSPTLPARPSASLPALSPASGAVLADEPAAAIAPSPPRQPVTAPAEIVERVDEGGREVSPAAGPAAPRPPAGAADKPATRPTDDGGRAQALLDGQGAGAPPARTVVQVGAYSDPDKLREARQKVERLGLKTYTQVIEVDGSRRTRVRVGPFASRAEADKAAARIKAAGLPVAVLSL